MSELSLFYATNRNHLGDDRWHPTGYGTKFSDDGMENLRFGRLSVEADEAILAQHLAARAAGGLVDGSALASYLTERTDSASIQAYRETLDPTASDTVQGAAALGSTAFFADLQAIMQGGTDVVVLIHGFNVSWRSAVGSALALQVALNRTDGSDPTQQIRVVLFSWPSDGQALPFVSYKSDRSEAIGSGFAVGRAFLKVRDFLAALRDRRDPSVLCGQDIHLLCHSMGNFVLQNALVRMSEHTPGNALPRLFEHVFLCAPDVDDNAVEADQPLAPVHEIARTVTIYHNRGDKAMYVSEYTKGNPERLGTNGASRPSLLHNKVSQVDCTAIAGGDFIQHSYYASGLTNLDIRYSLEGLALDDPLRLRRRGDLPNVWAIPPAAVPG